MSSDVIRELDTVALVRDLPEHGLSRGDLAAVVHVHSADEFEVEFVRASGGTEAVLTLHASDVRTIDDNDVLAVRASTPRSRGAA